MIGYILIWEENRPAVTKMPGVKDCDICEDLRGFAPYVGSSHGMEDRTSQVFPLPSISNLFKKFFSNNVKNGRVKRSLNGTESHIEDWDPFRMRKVEVIDSRAKNLETIQMRGRNLPPHNFQVHLLS